MHEIRNHPVIDIPEEKKMSFLFNGQQVMASGDLTIAAALHRAGFPVHSHSLSGRNRSLECGIGKCGACEMLVDGQVKRICITLAAGVKEVSAVPPGFVPRATPPRTIRPVREYHTTVAIIGAGPAGLAAREELRRHQVDTIVIDSNDRTGGQFLMQTHPFFFFEKEKKFGGMRGFDIAGALAGDDREGIFLNSTVWDIFEDRRLAVKNITTGEIFYVAAEHLVVATGAMPFMPAFGNDDLPGVYTAAVIQKMMNREFTLLGKNILTVGAGNIGYLTSYQLMQAGARVQAIIEAQARGRRLSRPGQPRTPARYPGHYVPYPRQRHTQRQGRRDHGGRHRQKRKFPRRARHRTGDRRHRCHQYLYGTSAR